MQTDHPALEQMRLAVEALATGRGPIHSRLQAAEPHFGRAFEREMRTPAEKHLRLRLYELVAGLRTDDGYGLSM